MTATKATNLKLRRRVPPLNPLRAFEVAARHLSFTRAADELSVTAGAVSRSVSALEDYLGFPLLERHAAGLNISPQNREFALALTEAFSRISDAVDTLIDQRSHVLLTVRAYTAFMVNWLIPNLASFHQQHPEVEVRLVSANERVRTESDRADVRIQYGRGKWRGRHSVFLFPDEIGTVCSPSVAKAMQGDVCSFLQSTPLLVCNMRPNDWSDWLEAAGIQGLSKVRELHFEEASVMYEAAAAGLGVAVAQQAHVRKQFASGQLVAPMPTLLERDAGYYATYASDQEVPQAVPAFCEWLKELTIGER